MSTFPSANELLQTLSGRSRCTMPYYPAITITNYYQEYKTTKFKYQSDSSESSEQEYHELPESMPTDRRTTKPTTSSRQATNPPSTRAPSPIQEKTPRAPVTTPQTPRTRPVPMPEFKMDMPRAFDGNPANFTSFS